MAVSKASLCLRLRLLCCVLLPLFLLLHLRLAKSSSDNRQPNARYLARLIHSSEPADFSKANFAATLSIQYYHTPLDEFGCLTGYNK